MHEPERYSQWDRWIDRRDRELRRPWATGSPRSGSLRSIFLNQYLDGLSIPDPFEDWDDDCDPEGGAV